MSRLGRFRSPPTMSSEPSQSVVTRFLKNCGVSRDKLSEFLLIRLDTFTIVASHNINDEEREIELAGKAVALHQASNQLVWALPESSEDDSDTAKLDDDGDETMTYNERAKTGSRRNVPPNPRPPPIQTSTSEGPSVNRHKIRLLSNSNEDVLPRNFDLDKLQESLGLIVDPDDPHHATVNSDDNDEYDYEEEDDDEENTNVAKYARFKGDIMIHRHKKIRKETIAGAAKEIELLKDAQLDAISRADHKGYLISGLHYFSQSLNDDRWLYEGT